MGVVYYQNIISAFVGGGDRDKINKMKTRIAFF